MLLRSIVVVGACAVIAMFLLAPAGHAELVTARVDVALSGASPNGSSWWPVMSADGRFIAFHSWATNLVPGDANGVYDIFVWDRALRTMQLVSLSAAGAQSNASCTYPAISADANVVAFLSPATNLVATAVNGRQQVYVRDRQAGVTEVVSVSTSGEIADGDCEWCAVSGDGRYVAFDSYATNLIPGGNRHIGVYLRDRLLGTTQCISVSTNGDLADWDALRPRITPDGRFVLFCSLADNLVPDDTNAAKDLFLRDLQNGTTERISVTDITGDQGNAPSAAAPPPAITPDGRFIAFASEATNLVTSDTNAAWDIFVRDRQEGRTELVSVSTSGEQGNNTSGHTVGGLAISDDGRYVLFPSLATNLAPGDTQGFWDAFLRDRYNQTTDLLSISMTGSSGNGDSGCHSVAMTADGRVIVFDSAATDLLPGPADTFTHVYLRAPATPSRPPAMVIDDGAPYTSSAQVTLTIDSGSWTQIRLRNEPGDWSGWEPSVARKDWLLSPGDGIKQVCVQGLAPDLFAESDVASAQITLDTAPPGDVSITINDGAATTSTPAVVLALSASDAGEMRFRNESGDWSSWEPFATAKDWSLSPRREMKTVSFQCRDETGNLSQIASAAIELIWFTDVSSGFWAYSEIAGCADAGIVSGYDDGTYRPIFPVTRDQMAVYIARALAGGDANIPRDYTVPSFTDVPTTSWAFHYIEYAAEMNVVRGYQDGSYQPPVAVDRGTMAVYIARSIVKPIGDDSSLTRPVISTFPDVATDFWAYAHIEYCVSQGVVRGYDDGLYHPEIVVTRDQMAVYVARAFGPLM